jgi:prepilin-type N-terminal cleavage/methylation domain-containing protein
MKLCISPHNRRQAGYTLIELMCALAITGIISLGVSASIYQVLNHTTSNSDYVSANRNAMNAIHWVSRDAMMAQTINGTTGFPSTSNLVLKWTTWDSDECTANYTLENGQLRRIFSDGTNQSQTLVAEYINAESGKTYCYTDNGTLTFVITSSIGQGSKVIEVQREREIVMRPCL